MRSAPAKLPDCFASTTNCPPLRTLPRRACRCIRHEIILLQYVLVTRRCLGQLRIPADTHIFSCSRKRPRRPSPRPRAARRPMLATLGGDLAGRALSAACCRASSSAMRCSASGRGTLAANVYISEGKDERVLRALEGAARAVRGVGACGIGGLPTLLPPCDLPAHQALPSPAPFPLPNPRGINAARHHSRSRARIHHKFKSISPRSVRARLCRRRVPPDGVHPRLSGPGLGAPRPTPPPSAPPSPAMPSARDRPAVFD